MDSSSGRSVKYQNTRCGTARLFYRHAAGAADAANLHTGGRCVLDGGFKRLDLGGGTNLPQGEIYSMGHEAPNHDCDPNDNSAGGCKASFIFNTIADAEACCEQCRSMNWVPLLGGVVETDGSNGAQINPCVAWQVVEGRCRINRKYYYDMYNSGQLIKDALLDNLYPAPGNPGWLVRTRGCGSSMERCNYFSYIYYRELQDSNVHPVGVRSSTNATYRKVMGGNLSDLTENITLEVRASSVQSRHDRRLSLLSQGDGDDSDESSLEKSDGTDVGLVEVYDSSALRSSGDYDIFDEESGPVPLCTTGLISSNSPVALSCSLASSGGRRLREVGDIFFVFTAVGSGHTAEQEVEVASMPVSRLFVQEVSHVLRERGEALLEARSSQGTSSWNLCLANLLRCQIAGPPATPASWPSRPTIREGEGGVRTGRGPGGARHRATLEDEEGEEEEWIDELEMSEATRAREATGAEPNTDLRAAGHDQEPATTDYRPERVDHCEASFGWQSQDEAPGHGVLAVVGPT
eukprot:g3576.t1